MNHNNAITAFNGKAKNSNGKFPNMHCNTTDSRNSNENNRLVVKFIHLWLVK